MESFKKNVFFFLTIFSAVSFGACPTPPTAIDPEIKVDHQYDKKTLDHIYTYTLKNGSSAKTSMWMLKIESSEMVYPVSIPKDWKIQFQGPPTYSPSVNSFSSSFNKIEPGKKVELKFKSKLGPGLTKFYAEGTPSDQLQAITVDGDNEVAPVCPGFFMEETDTDREMVSGVIIGPVSGNQVDAKLKMKLLKEKPEKGEDDEADAPTISPADDGIVELVLRQAEGIDLNAVDLSSITFGPYETSPISSELIQSEHKIKHWRNKPNEKKMILMKFKLSDLKIRCELDRALLLKAVAGDKKLVGVINIKPKLCDKNLMNIHSKRLKMDKKNYRQQEVEH